LRIESLELRALLSVLPVAATDVQPRPAYMIVTRPDAGPVSPSALVPNQLRGAYGLGTYNSSGVLSGAITFHGLPADGTGQTIAIVDAYDAPNALSDLNTFSAAYNLPQFNVAGGPTFEKLNEYGAPALPGTDPNGAYNGGSSGDWEVEESLDIEWAHVVAPMANIILFEASEANDPLGLFTAVQTAAATTDVVVVSMSWSADEFSSEAYYDSDFTTPAGHLGGSGTTGAELPGGVTFLASTGDEGAYGTAGTANDETTITPQYPASSPNVVAVGGTTLSPNGDAYGSEASWGNGTSSGILGGGGGGISGTSGINPETQPAYQDGVVSSFSTADRTYPDVAADASPATGVPIYDSFVANGVSHWLSVGGTSLSCPLWAGMVALADQGRAIAGLGSLDGPSQTLPALYQLSFADFNDITSGNPIGPSPTYSPGTGYNLATGLGSPVGNLLIPQLAGPSILAISQGPTSALAGANISPAITVDVEDALGNIVAGYTGNVTLSIGNNPSQGNLLGTRTVAAVDGVATFSGLAIDAAGNGYTLFASDGGLSTAASAAFNISANAAQPSVAAAASATPGVVTGTSTNLSVLGADPAGESNLTYTWSALALPYGAAAPAFSANDSNAAKNTTASFSSAGVYVFLVTITDASGFSVGSTVSVTVRQTFTGITVAPLAGLGADGAQPFAATALDQFGNVLANQPQFNWSVVGDGNITSTGVFSPPYEDGTATIQATSGSVTGSDGVAFPGVAEWGSVPGATWNTASAWTSTALNTAVGNPGLRGVAGDEVLFDLWGGEVDLDGVSPSLADMTFDSTSGYTIGQGSGGALQLDGGASPATVTVMSGSHTISAPVALDSDVALLPAAGSQLTLSGGIAGAGQSLLVDAPGTIVLEGANSYTGGTIVSAGTLIVDDSTALASGTSLTVGADAATLFGPPVGQADVPAAAPAMAKPAPASSAAPAAKSAAMPGLAAAPPRIIPASPQTPGSPPAAPSRATAAGQFAASAIAGKRAADLAWLAQVAGSPGASDQRHPHISLPALDAVFAQYGR
jgi:autotransporter-associated beta strand protein